MNLNDKGISMMESLVAIVLTVIAIVGLLSMQPLSWQSAGRADSMTRATELLQTELEVIEFGIMSGSVPANKVNVDQKMGNETFTVNSTVTAGTGNWLAHVRVTWPGNAKGVRSSMIVPRRTEF